MIGDNVRDALLNTPGTIYRKLHEERCEKCGARKLNHDKDHLCRMHLVNGICEICGDGKGYLSQRSTITVCTSFYKVEDGGPVKGIKIDRDQFGRVLLAEEMMHWPFLVVDWCKP